MKKFFLNQLRNDYNAVKLSHQGKGRMKMHIFIGRTRNSPTSASQGMIFSTLRKRKLNRSRCEYCNYYCTLPLGKKPALAPSRTRLMRNIGRYKVISSVSIKPVTDP